MLKPEATLIISVYANTVFLKAVLDSLKDQTWNNFDIIVSEDGESLEMKTFLSSYPFEHPWQHLTQEDLGWRKNSALNKAVMNAKSDYFVFIDGDCVLHPRFMEMHHLFSKTNEILAGKRLKLNDDLSQKLILQRLSVKEVEYFLIRNFFKLRKLGVKFQEEGFFIDPDKILGFIPGIRKMTQLKGCNMSFSRAALLRINGFDEDYIKPAIGEDIDLAWRFKKAGYALFSLRNLAVQYHLNHKENWTDQSENIQMMNEKQKANLYICLNGIEKIR